MVSRPIVVEYLQLTPDQKQKVAQYLAESTKQRTRATWTSLDHIKLTRKAVAILSDKQKELWADLLGRPCQFSTVGQQRTSQVPQSDRGT